MAQFDALPMILEPHIKKKTTNFCELSVQGSMCALCCEIKWMNLTSAILDFAVRLYVASKLSKHLSKCLPRMREFFLRRMKISEAVCKCDWHNVRSYLFFNVRTFHVQWPLHFVNGYRENLGTLNDWGSHTTTFWTQTHVSNSNEKNVRSKIGSKYQTCLISSYW